MKEKFLALIASNRGRMVSAITAFIVGGITQFITSKGFQLPGEVAVAISGMVAATAGWLIDHIAARVQSTGITAIQDALPGVKTTGAATPSTVAAVERLVTATGIPAGESGAPLSEKEELLIKQRLRFICQQSPSLAAELRFAIKDAA